VLFENDKMINWEEGGDRIADLDIMPAATLGTNHNVEPENL